MLTATAYTPAYSQAATLERTVASLRAQTKAFDDAVTVRDGGDPEAWLKAGRLGLSVLMAGMEKAGGLAASCNAALHQCETDLLAKVDSDVELAPDWLATALPHFADPRVAGVGGKLTELYASRIPDRFRAKYLVQHHGPEPKTNLVLFGAACIFRVSALRAVGGWNAKYRTNYEDVDLSRRLVEGGFTLVYDPACEARHLKRDTLLSVLDTNWNYTRWICENGGCFASLERAAELLPQRVGFLAEYLRHEATYDPGMLYPLLLLFWRSAQLDLRHMVRLGAIGQSFGDNLQGLLVQRSHVFTSRIYRRMQMDLSAPLLASNQMAGSPYCLKFQAVTTALEAALPSPWLLETSLDALEAEEDAP